MNLAISFSLLLRLLPCTFTSSPFSLSLSLSSLRSLSLFVCLLRARRRRRQAVWLVLGSPSRYYHVRYKNRRQPVRTTAVAFLPGKNVRRAWYLSMNVLSHPTRLCSILAINFFLLPSSSRFLPISLTSLPFSVFLADCITLCRRQAVWPVYSSVASSPLSPPSVPLPLSILIPFLAVHSSLAHLHRRCCATHGHVPYLSLARVRYLSCLRVRYVSRLRPSPSPASPLKPVQYR